MKTLIVYDSTFGNTEHIARAIAATLGEGGPAPMAAVQDMGALGVTALDLLVVGGPTQRHGISPALRAALNTVPEGSLRGVAVAAFDTRMRAARLLWPEGLSLRPREAPQFYGVMIVATLAGLGINSIGLSPIKALVYAAVVNGVVAVPLILVILLVSTNRAVMGPYVNRRWVTAVGWCTFAGMGLAALTMLLTWKS